jgi:radical SAM superfamily enzyme YgiQ (UPF0313 family)
VHYVEPVFRPPSEADSLLLPTTVGCSHRRCTFCGMYAGKRFQLGELSDIFADIEEARSYGPVFRRVFLLDGDALAAPEPFLLEVLGRIRERLPWVGRVGTYGEARAILEKGADGLARLRAAGLGIVYHGLESGSAEVLARVHKPIARDDLRECGRVLRASGVGYSVMAILGLGGVELSEEHARETGPALSLLDPDYVGLLTLMLVPGTPLARAHEQGRFVLPDRLGMLRELRTILAGLEVTRARFSANHASNYLPLRGDLPGDRERLLAVVDAILATGDDSRLRPDACRAL